MLVVIALIVCLATVLYLLSNSYAKSKLQIWSSQGVPYIDRGKVSSFWSIFTQKVPFSEIDEKIFTKGGDVDYFGYVEFMEPVLYLKDVEMIKQITIKDFDHFVDRRVIKFGKSDEIFSRMMINMSGKEWKDLRSVMSPTFTTGKMRRMFQLFNQVGNGLTQFLKKKHQESDVFDFQDAFGRFTLAAISAIAFGQTTDVFEDDSTFRQMAVRINTVSFYRLLKFILFATAPKLCKLLGITITDAVSVNFFRSIIEQNIKKRKSEGGESSKRNDFLQLLLEAQAGRLKTEENELDAYEKDAALKESEKSHEAVLDDVTIVAQCVLFFVAGSDTLESALTVTAYELALNPEVQEKLALEIQETLAKSDGELSYDNINSMQYLEQVLSEALRLHPPAFATERQCTSDYVLPGTNVKIPKGTRLMIPIRNIHRSEKHYPEPLKFNPENFSPENKAKRHAYAYLPFGLGPRNCIAMRFALMEAKAALVHLIKNFKIEPCDKTPIPFKANPTTGILKSVGGMPLKFSLR